MYLTKVSVLFAVLFSGLTVAAPAAAAPDDNEAVVSGGDLLARDDMMEERRDYEAKTSRKQPTPSPSTLPAKTKVEASRGVRPVRSGASVYCPNDDEGPCYIETFSKRHHPKYTSSKSEADPSLTTVLTPGPTAGVALPSDFTLK